IGHEMTHGVTQFEAKLVYAGQSGALNESFSDVFGVLVKQYKLRQTALDADWIIGSGLFTPNVNGVGIRSMKAPGTAYNDPVLGKDPQPAHMDQYQNVPYDNGGVHINSGIPNHAFYITARDMGGFAWEKAGQIWYSALCDKLSSLSNFQAAANATYTTAGERFGANSLEQQAVRNGWAEVGLSVEAASPTDGCFPILNPVLRLFRQT
ncbi:MAG TPA: M4 family metallopeptidase, partial [Aggregatilineaceae bacterium]|nr:M4 family metallopeptidase [Aggregatilineaceae bacterium]